MAYRKIASRLWQVLPLMLLGWSGVVAWAVPPSPLPMPNTPASRDRRSGEFADALIEICTSLSNQYVKPIPRSELAVAAMDALYDSQRKPFPPEFRRPIVQANNWQSLSSALQQARSYLGNSASLDDRRDLIQSLEAIGARLDPYCGIVPSSEFSIAGDVTSGYGFELVGQTTGPAKNFRRGGIPLAPSLRLLPEPLAFPWRVQQVIPGSPAQIAGMKPDDILTEIDGVPIREANSAEVLRRLLQPASPTTRTRFQILRKGSPEPRTLVISPGVFSPESVFGIRRSSASEWDYWLDRGEKLAFIRIGSITRQTPDQLADAIQQLESDGMNGLILDLRACPGGYLDPAIAVASIFVSEGMIAQSISRDVLQPTIYRTNRVASTRFQAGDYPVVVLIGPDTSGGGELIAAAIQDNRRAILAGERTRGKATIQKGIEVGLGDQMFKLTTGFFQRPSGKNLQRFPDSRLTDDWGVQPDDNARFPLTDDIREEIRNHWTLQILRPADAGEILPLDDPRADPQQQAALQRLRRAIKEPRPAPIPAVKPDLLPPLDPIR
ncbi:S41 family peptidase [Tuwongella immobilis]|uniref:PDZ domain-containing protein n=1 Tax=Tuwongella immobilis TaxID=692036 RepID=A0A6C2YMG3_9BACT|nr:S41 family peptidase [Tuwongella immobilis]VIP02265.1 carboxyl-terminal protease : Carboxyl-terminal protease OS=Planctomyces limnophilus (strain ATCC 43296 / DSM 3776 / IFAM 1008 / 290) GN=Plim_2514 PE=3 SV=1: PDZ_2: Peptidase_S41 [Tuwongella immobilis]VTS00882.1 carboxyl-terminal protease : Carboxyl-terminal protease OS=Planctomyces limnophilus (strain ATCC 43296 / DSM 3776 / IFAM 1008 / 290) GN=Plim_2514 PE=3 SV=1: PDZ_2: Peptidase_S41 [Tuwongella immobilis]